MPTGLPAPMVLAHRRGGWGVLFSPCSQLKERLRCMAALNGAGPRPGGRGFKLSWWSQPKGRLRGMAACNGAGSPTRGKGILVHSAVAAYGAPAGDGGHEWCWPMGWGNAKFSGAKGAPAGDGTTQLCKPMCRGTGSPVWSVVLAKGAPAGDGSQQWCGLAGWGREILRIPWSQPMGHLQGMAAPNGAGPRAGGRCI